MLKHTVYLNSMLGSQGNIYGCAITPGGPTVLDSSELVCLKNIISMAVYDLVARLVRYLLCQHVRTVCLRDRMGKARDSGSTRVRRPGFESRGRHGRPNRKIGST